MPVIAAVVTLYRPPPDLLLQMESVVDFCDFIVLVDNSPGGAKGIKPRDGVLLLCDGVNKGLARALNLGVDAAIGAGADYIILLDQDSRPALWVLRALYDAVRSRSKAICAPTFAEHSLEFNGCGEAAYLREDPKQVSALPTSGMFFRVSDIPVDVFFDETLFLDFVDFDWSWQVSLSGVKLLRFTTLPMLHKLGNGARKVLGVRVHVPEPYRHYFQFRDAIRLLRRGYVPIYAKFRLNMILFPKILIYPFAMDRGLERLKWMLVGIRDVFNGRTGIGSALDRLGR